MRKSLFSNLRFMWRTYNDVDKLYLPVMFMQVIVHMVGALLGIILPKVVIDAVTIHADITQLLLYICGMTVGLMVAKAVSIKLQSQLDMRAWRIFYFYGYDVINRKRMTMRYETYASPVGKDKAQKALRSVSGYIFSSIAAFFVYTKDVLLNLLGFTSFAAILAMLSPWVIVGLLLTYVLNMGIARAVEKWKYSLHAREAQIWRKKQYFSKQLSLTKYAKDIRIYSLAGLIRSLRTVLLDEELLVEASQQRRVMCQVIFQGILVLLRDGLAYAYLIYSMLNDPDMTLGMFTLYFSAIAGFGDWLSELIEACQGLMEANGYVRDFREFMETEADDGANERLPEKDVSCSIRFEHVTYSYPGSEKPTLRDISMEIRPGEKLGLVGINGAGKSTLVKLICGLIKPTGGRIYLNDMDISRIDKDDYFDQIGAVFQDINVMPVSIADNITFCHALNGEQRRRMWRAMDDAGIADKVRSLPHAEDTLLMKQFDPEAVDLSGGETQKLLLARALYKDAPVLLLDEPTAALDPVAENELYQKYMTLMRNKTSVFISHRLSSTAFCDRVIVLDDGIIAECGTHEELMEKQGIYARMFEASSKYYREEAVL